MSITDDEYRRYGIKFLYHFTHVDNMSSILAYGLLSHNDARRLGYIDISNKEVQRRRTEKKTHGRALHDYVLLYFNARNPMLYVVQQTVPDHDIAVLCWDRRLLEIDGSIFTDGNAASDISGFFSDCHKLSELDWECIHSHDKPWQYPDGKRIRCAEVLVPGPIPIERMKRIIVKTPDAKQRLDKTLIGYGGIRERVAVDSMVFFDR